MKTKPRKGRLARRIAIVAAQLTPTVLSGGLIISLS